MTFKNWFIETHGFEPTTMENLNFSAHLLQAWNASRQQTISQVLEILEKNGWNETFKECKIMTDRLINIIKRELGYL